MKPTSEYRDIDWAKIVVDYFLQQIEAGMNVTEAKAATKCLYDRLAAVLTENEFSCVRDTIVTASSSVWKQKRIASSFSMSFTSCSCV